MASHGGGGMIRTILIWLGIVIVVVLIILWLLTGGPGRVVQAARSTGNPFAELFSFGSGDGQFRLPWQPELPYGPEADVGGSGNTDAPPSDSVSAVEEEYDELQRNIADAKNFGEPSPYRGSVIITDHSVSGGAEYVVIEASSANTAPVSVSGWSLQSAVTGVRGYLPRGASVFYMGVVNAQNNIALAPGERAILSSASSPVGTSFRENMCTGHFSQLQDFVPSLSHRCPEPSSALPLTAENLQRYGEKCFDYIDTLPACTYPLTAPPELSVACVSFIAQRLSYNGCVEDNRYRSDFLGDVWRVYLGAGGQLWRDSHDVIRLLDESGRTVDVLVY